MKLPDLSIEKMLFNQIEKVKESYTRTKSIRETAKELGVKYNRMLKFLCKINFKIKKPYKVYDLIDDNFLENIDCEWKAYYLGLLYADGCLFRNRLALTLIDKDILEKLSRKIFVNRELWVDNRHVKNGTGKTTYLLAVSGKQIREHSLNLGLHEKKSLTVDFPEWARQSKFLGDFIRGYFDGDGCLYSRKKCKENKRAHIVSICVSDIFGIKIKDILNKMGVKCILKKSGKISLLLINRIDSIYKFKNLLYENSPEFYLLRKKEKFNEFEKIRNEYLEEKTKKFKRIYYFAQDKKWICNIYNKKTGKVNYIGRFKTEESALQAQQKRAMEIEYGN